MGAMEMLLQIFGMGVFLVCISFLILGIMISSAVNDKISKFTNIPIESITNGDIITKEIPNTKHKTTKTAPTTATILKTTLTGDLDQLLS